MAPPPPNPFGGAPPSRQFHRPDRRDGAHHVLYHRSRVSNLTPDKMAVNTAPVKWAQRADSIYLTLDLPDVKDEQLKLTKDMLSFRQVVYTECTFPKCCAAVCRLFLLPLLLPLGLSYRQRIAASRGKIVQCGWCFTTLRPRCICSQRVRGTCRARCPWCKNLWEEVKNSQKINSTSGSKTAPETATLYHTAVLVRSPEKSKSNIHRYFG